VVDTASDPPRLCHAEWDHCLRPVQHFEGVQLFKHNRLLFPEHYHLKALVEAYYNKGFAFNGQGLPPLPNRPLSRDSTLFYLSIYAHRHEIICYTSPRNCGVDLNLITAMRSAAHNLRGFSESYCLQNFHDIYTRRPQSTKKISLNCLRWILVLFYTKITNTDTSRSFSAPAFLEPSIHNNMYFQTLTFSRRGCGSR